MKDRIAFGTVEKEAVKRFKRYQVYQNDVFFPQVKVAGPDGKMVALPDGKHYTVLNVWATWCAPCVAELPALKRLDKILSYDKKWRIVAVSVDKPEDIEKVTEFTKKLKIEALAGYFDINNELQRAINIKGLPMTLILDKRGKILYEVYGDAIWYEANIVTLLRNIEWAQKYK